MKNLNNKNILILGYGKSGKSACEFLLKMKANIFVYDKNFTVNILNDKNIKALNKTSKTNNEYKKINQIKLIKLKNNKIFKINSANLNNVNSIFYKKIFNKKNYDIKQFTPKTQIFNLEPNITFLDNLNNLKALNINLCVISPGISLNSNEFKKVKEAKIKTISELELGAKYCKGKIFAITGTNGKTTTVNLLYEIFKTAKKQTFLCGNVGTPICEIAHKTTKNSYIVCEVSSYQLETTEQFYPYATCFLNLQADHLKRHKTMIKYGYIKDKINKYYKSKKVYNLNDKYSVYYSNNISKAIYFSVDKKTNGAYFNQKDNSIFYKNEKVMNIDKIKLIGRKNLENILSAISLAKLANINNKYIEKAINQFNPLPHRLEIFKIYNNIIFINDSKSTNVESTNFAIEAIKDYYKNLASNIILLLGGSDKNLNFSSIFEHKLKCVIAYGETLTKICKVAKNTNIITANNLKSASEKAFKIARSYDIVLLSPACSSFDEFSSYEQRGTCFKKIINNLCSTYKTKDN